MNMDNKQKTARATFIKAFLASAPIGRKGWRDRALLQAENAWKQVQVAREKRGEAEALLQAQEERGTPKWGVEEEWGSHSFSGTLTGAVARFGKGDLTWAEAQAQAEAITASARCRQSAKEWDDFMSR